ncbi:MAG: hypothetical protein KDE53_21450 [Caldilineaceae bacterium]|nr:hypothetical protein [Caldilineaceae bacterium]
MKQLLIAAVAILMSAIPVAAKDGLVVGIHYWTKVHQGMGQSYNVKIVGNVHGVYIVLSLHPDNDIFAVNHSEGIQCAEMPGDGLTVMCYLDHLNGEESLGVHGTVRGPGNDGFYGILRVGTLEEGSPGRGWMLNANYEESMGTIPSVITPDLEPIRSRIYIPGVTTE